MTPLFTEKDNEFVAWYPLGLTDAAAPEVWTPRRAAYYVHVPFCTAICDYCGFAVEQARGASIERYLSALLREIDRYRETRRLASHRFACGHFGGGTPSVLAGADFVRIKRALDEALDVEPEAEVTVEVNPISLTSEKSDAYLSCGVNRISVGIQSFDNDTLRTIGRPHRADDVRRALDVIAAAGWRDFSLDLIYGVPGQTPERLREDLVRAIDTGATHLSCFRLEIIPFTVLKLREAAQQLPPRLSTEGLNDMDDLVTELLTSNGYREYGAFNFARPGYESVHNSIAFVAPQADYIGFGNSSYSYINGWIFTNHAAVQEYEEAVEAGRDPIAFAHRVSTFEAMSRYFVLGVKFFRVPRAPFIDQFGLQPERVFGKQLRRLCAEGLLARDGDDYLLTRHGRHFVNNVCKFFYVGESRGRRQHAQFVPTLTAEQIGFYAEKRRIALEQQAEGIGD